MRRAWVDPRLAVGAALVVASIGGVWLVVEGASRTTTTWVAERTLLPGDVLDEGDLVERDVRLGEAGDRYLAAEADPDGLVAVATVRAGELVPAASVGDAASVDLAAVVLGVDGGLASTVDAGAVVDLWSAPPVDQRGFGPPAVLVSDAIVVGVVEDDGLIASDDVRLELLVPRAAVGEVLDAIANAHAMSVVPVAAGGAP